MADNKQEYLKRYLSASDNKETKKKRRKKIKPTTHTGLRIIDNDVDFKSTLPSNLTNAVDEDFEIDVPTVADVVDERPTEIQILENYRESGKWKTLEKRNEEKQRHDSDSDHSTPRKQRHDSDSDQSPPRKQRYDSDSDQSPPRKRRPDSDSDQSPPRKPRHSMPKDKSGRSSPPNSHHKRSSRFDDDRKAKHSSNDHPPRRGDDGKMKRTLSGATAGLSSAKEMKYEIEQTKQREADAFEQIDNETLGKDSSTVFRDKSGQRRNFKDERKKQREEESRKAEQIEKYAEWGKGVKQKEMQTESLQDTMHEMQKPLARYKDDEDLEKMLKNKVREDDPMIAFLKKKETKDPKKKSKPLYQGTFPANRYNLRPGYRWDGVDRSNGFEKQFFLKQSTNKANAEQAFKWSVEDM